MRIYLSGPMSGYLGYNEKGFREAEQLIREAFGDEVEYLYNPADKIPEYEGIGHDEAMRHSVNELTSDQKYTHLVLLEDYWFSKGAMLEVDVAHECGIEILDLAMIEKVRPMMNLKDGKR